MKKLLPLFLLLASVGETIWAQSTIDATGLFTIWTRHTATSGNWYGKCTSNTNPAISVEQNGTEDAIGWSTSNSVKRPWLKAGYTYNITANIPTNKIITGYTLTTQSTSSGYTGTYTYTSADGTSTSEAQKVNTDKTVTVTGIRTNKITITLSGSAGTSNYGVLITGLTLTYDDRVTRSKTVMAFGSETGIEGSTTDAWNITNMSSASETLKNGNSMTLTPSAGNLWSGATDGGIYGTWSNTTALNDLNSDFSTEFSTDHFSEGSTLYYTATGNSGSTSTLTLNFAGTETLGDSVIIYAAVARRAAVLDNFSVSGLYKAKLSYATNSGTGFSSTASFSSEYSNNLSAVTLIKITGTLTSAKSIVLGSTSAKNGWQMVACKVVEGDPLAYVTLNYKYDGTTVKTITEGFEVNADVVAPAITGYSVTQPTATATDGLSVDVECTPYITCKYVFIANDNDTKLQASDESGTLTFAETDNRLLDKYIWKVGITSDGYYTFQNVGTGKYMKHKGVQDAAYNFDLRAGFVDGNYSMYSLADSRYFVIKYDGTLDQATGTYNKTSTNFSTDFIFEEAVINTLTITSNPAISGIFNWNGETKLGSTVTFACIGGTTVTSSDITVTDNGYTTSLSATTWDGQSDASVTANVTPAFFTTAEDFAAQNENVKWLRIKSAVNNNYVMSAAKGTTNMTTTTTDVTAVSQIFCFVGNATNGFKIYSKAKGSSMALYTANTTSGTAPSWVDAASASTWHLDDKYANAASQPGYGLTTDDITTSSDRQSLNLWAGTTGEAKFWGNGSGNGGSRWAIEPVTEHDITIADGGVVNPYPTTNTHMGKVTVQYGNQTSSHYFTVNEIGTTSLYVPMGLSMNITTARANRGWTVEVNATTITFTAQTKEENKYQYLFTNDEESQFYRIPAIARNLKGELVAFSDYRYCHNDIGFGRIDQGMRISSDNGATWSDPVVIVSGDGGSTWQAGYGDPALVADCESNRMLLITVCGATVYGSADNTTGNPNRVARFYSEDGGHTWSEPIEITDDVYKCFDGSTYNGEEDPVKSLFFGSGRILQSRYTKVGDYYRLYAALCARPNGNRVIYSDDFGKTWQALGGVSAHPAPDGDEPKCEELPDGSVILSSRKYYGRYFNIYTFTDATTGAGAWGSEINSGAQTGGISNNSRATNGEILVVKAKTAADETIHTVVLQSLPKNERKDVEIWWKDITDATSYQANSVNDVATFAAGWTRGLYVSGANSAFTPTDGAYSTMCVQSDGNIAFYYEEDPGCYAMVYVPLSISEITNGAYTKLYTFKTLAKNNDSTTDPALIGDVTTPSEVTDLIDTSATSLDLTKTTINDNTIEAIQTAVLEKTGNANTLIYAPAGTVVTSANNVVVDGNCQNLVLTDGNVFSAPTDFTANTATYTRSMDNQYGTICLPYAVESSGNTIYYTISECTDNLLTLTECTTLPAGTPAIICTGSTGDVTCAANTIPVKGAIGTSGIEGTLTMYGTYQPVTVTDANAYYIKNNKFWQRAEKTETVTDPHFTIDPYRAYFTIEENNPAKSYSLSADEDATAIQTINALTQSNVQIYDLNGRRLHVLQRGINIVNGHKVLVK